ncbi:MAG TPA: WecB/TagA/CpsF family glycosyltransferase [Pseudobacteroides sp.]|uniref:WecB/TagA/CpsF family glycosyltransferase n=1 Tax=Pseudobacteroides sp. TaxID=1968840 RepID=UPI002F95461C
MRNTVDILGVPVDKLNMRQSVNTVTAFLSQNKLHAVYTPNAEIMMEAHRNPYLKDILCQADLLVADGAGVVLASKILGLGLPERVAGFDLIKNLFAEAENIKMRFFLFGGKPGIAEEAEKYLLANYKNIEVVGVRSGYFSSSEEKEIIDQINSSKADILLVALGAPKQEIWIHEHKRLLNAKVCIGVGGSLDILSGNVKRAPEFFQKYGLEWFYRLCKEPWRYKRMMDLPRFIMKVLQVRLSSKKSKTV